MLICRCSERESEVQDRISFFFYSLLEPPARDAMRVFLCFLFDCILSLSLPLFPFSLSAFVWAYTCRSLSLSLSKYIRRRLHPWRERESSVYIGACQGGGGGGNAFDIHCRIILSLSICSATISGPPAHPAITDFSSFVSPNGALLQ